MTMRWKLLLAFTTLIVIGVFNAKVKSPDTAGEISAQDGASGTLRPYSAERIRECDSLLARSAATGLIRERRYNVRIVVEDLDWAQFPADSKRGVLLALGCSAYGRPLQGMEAVFAYGYRSGKIVGSATKVGTDF